MSSARFFNLPRAAIPIAPPRPAPVRQEAFAAWVVRKSAEAYGLSVEEVLGPSHEPHLVPARRAAAQRLRAAGWSLPRIGRVMGGRHHTSVWYWLRSAPPPPPATAYDPDAPDYSGEWAI